MRINLFAISNAGQLIMERIVCTTICIMFIITVYNVNIIYRESIIACFTQVLYVVVGIKFRRIFLFLGVGVM